MSFLKRLGKALGSPPGSGPDALWVYVRCKRCGEVISARLNLSNEPSIQYDGSGRSTGYRVRKVLVGGTRRCYQAVEVNVTLDGNRRVVDREITGGEFITAEEFAAASQEA